MSGPTGGDAVEHEREMEEHERKAQEHEASERSPEATAEDGRAAKPAPPGTLGSLSGTQ